MTTERDSRTSIVLSWLREDAHENAERVLLRALDEVDTTPQRRPWWPARRFVPMNKLALAAGAAAAALAVAILGYSLIPGIGDIGGPTSPVATAESSPHATFMNRPFGPEGFGMCPPGYVDATCVEDPRDDSITFTFEAPESWIVEPGGIPWVDNNAPPDGVAFFFTRGNWLYSQPCRPGGELNPDIPVGPTVDDLVSAFVDHPLLDVTTPVDVTLAGYSGKYLDLQVPGDISDCVVYRPLEAHIYAQGPGQRWHMWILDVGGVRVVVETNDYAGTSAQRLGQLQAVVDSLVITP